LSSVKDYYSIMLYVVLRSFAVLILQLIFRIQVFGKKNIPKRGGFILASNHVSYLDSIVLGAACPRKLNFMAKRDLFHNPLFSRLLHMLGAFPIKRESADVSSLKEAIRRLKDGKIILLFPQGSRQVNGMSESAQPGIGFLAAKADMPVIPAFIKGTDFALPRGTRFIRPCQISVYFGKQISIERRMPYQEIAAKIMESIGHLSC
jgi:1-acyl-sn-glycerol-3-phosphate acyltransferase